MKKIFAMTICLFMFISCSSTPEPREAQRSYKVVDFSHSVQPKWLNNPTAGDSKKNKKKHRYFISESEHKNKRLCIKSAQARATATVASEISQFIKNTYAESTNSEEDEVNQYMQESLAQEVQAFVVGAEVYKMYWELQHYQKDLGAKKNYKKYSCHALIRIKKKILAKAIKNSTEQLYNQIKDLEVKENTKKILKDVADKFNNVY